MTVTLEQFRKMIPTNKQPEVWHAIAVDMFKKYDIVTINRIAGFMAQAAHESSDFKVLVENLNYSESGLLKTFGRYFTKETAKQYARKPEMIANHVYADANRTNKLGNTQEGDGWRFRGRGIFQLTGRWNYEKFGKSIGMTAEETADYMETSKGAFESALWYWKTNNLNRFADKDDIRGMSRAVNGGDNGLADRISKYSRNKTALEGYSVAAPVTAFPTAVNDQITDSVTQASTSSKTLQRGDRGDDVRAVQKALKIASDGVFGVTTEAAVRSWQRINRYTVTGKLDENQIKKLIGA